MKYTKPPLPFHDQLQLLKKRGLLIADDKKALHVLEHINYYRLSAYFLPFQGEKDIFDTGTALEDVLYLYEFDRRLRNLLAEGLGRIEISAKTQIAYHVALRYGAFGHLRQKNFDFRRPRVPRSHAQWLRKVRESVNRSHEVFKKHFFAKYDEEKDLPIWIATELMSFGLVSQLYCGMGKHDRQDIARGYFGIDQRLMTSWLHTVVYVRNLCAHHSRVWNRMLGIRPLTNKRDKDWDRVDNRKILGVFMLIKKMMHFQDKWDEWSGKLLVLLGEFPDIQVAQMGFPEDWRELLFERHKA